MLVTRKVVSGCATRRSSGTGGGSRSLPFTRSRVIDRSGFISPRFAKIVYALAISNGVASNTPNAIDGYGRAGVPMPMSFQSAATRS